MEMPDYIGWYWSSASSSAPAEIPRIGTRQKNKLQDKMKRQVKP
jgi:hypothetical protein